MMSWLVLMIVAMAYASAATWIFANAKKKDGVALKAALFLQKPCELTLSNLLNHPDFVSEATRLINTYSEIAAKDCMAFESYAGFCMLQLKFCSMQNSSVFDNLFAALIQNTVWILYGIRTPVYVYDDELQGAVVLKKFAYGITPEQVEELEKWHVKQAAAKNPLPPTVSIPIKKN